MGVKALKITESKGNLVGARSVDEDTDNIVIEIIPTDFDDLDVLDIEISSNNELLLSADDKRCDRIKRSKRC